MKRINFIEALIIIFILIFLNIYIYYQNNLKPKKYDISKYEIVEVGNKVQVGIKTIRNIYTIEVHVGKDEDTLKEYVNFISVEGKYDYINYSIILTNENNSYELNTILKQKEEDEFIFIGYVKTKNIESGTYSIGVEKQCFEGDNKDKEYHELYFSNDKYEL